MKKDELKSMPLSTTKAELNRMYPNEGRLKLRSIHHAIIETNNLIFPNYRSEKKENCVTNTELTEIVEMLGYPTGYVITEEFERAIEFNHKNRRRLKYKSILIEKCVKEIRNEIKYTEEYKHEGIINKLSEKYTLDSHFIRRIL